MSGGHEQPGQAFDWPQNRHSVRSARSRRLLKKSLDTSNSSIMLSAARRPLARVVEAPLLIARTYK
jgi:hypothetical protein